MSKVIAAYLQSKQAASCRLVTNFPGRSGNATYASGLLSFRPGQGPHGQGSEFRMPVPASLMGDLDWYFSDQSAPKGTVPFDTQAQPLKLTLVDGPGDEVGSLFNPNWGPRMSSEIGLHLLHEVDDPLHESDLILGLDGNGAGFVVTLMRFSPPK